MTVWICYTGCVHEGGGTPHAIYSNREAAEAWLQNQLTGAVEGSRRMREFTEKDGRKDEYDREPKWFDNEDCRGFTVVYDTHLIKRYVVSNTFESA